MVPSRGMIGHSVRTRDGRLLQVLEGGDKGGKPVFTLHGTPGSRLLYQKDLEDATKRRIRLIGYDRPGYGESTPNPGRNVVAAAADVITIADSLGIEKFAVWGVSGGGPHALACAARLEGRVVAVASLASPAPYPSTGLDYLNGMGEDNIAEFNASFAGKVELERFLRPQRAQLLTAKPSNIFDSLRTLLSPVDRAALTDDLIGFLQQDFREGLRNSSAGWRDDDLAFVNPWGFRLSKIKVPLLLWHGRHDRFVPFAHGQWLAKHIPGVRARLSNDDGHLTLEARRIGETHAWLLEHF